jgi:V/A-type H+-transporting ATPase subunit E
MMQGEEEKGGELQQGMHNAVLSISSDMLREGVEIIPSSDVPGGARVRVVGSDVEIDLTEEAISKLLLKHLLPRYRAILDGTE